jgi:hypothetical protein
MFKKLLVVVIVVASLAGLIGVASALFTSATTESANAFTSGTVILTTEHDGAVLVTFENMAPGDQYTRPITVTNSGTLPLRYAVTSLATDDAKHLMGQLDLTIKTAVTTCTDAGFGTDGVIRYGGAEADLGSVLGINVIGNPQQGNQPGDRTLAASASEILCLNVTLPISTTDAFQGGSTTATFNFAAEQTTNNP